MASAFAGHGFSFDQVSNGLSALDRIYSERYDLVISELDLFYLRGADLYLRALEKRPELEDRFLFISDREPEDAREKDAVRGRFFLKPFQADSIIRYALDLLKGRP